jgi:hypothetical protein
MPGFGAIGQYAIGEAQQITVTPTGWYAPLSEPVRQRPAIHPSRVQFFAFDPVPVVPFSWFEALSEPQRQKPRSPAALSPAFFMNPAPSPFVPTGWYMPLSEPQRQKPALLTARQQAWTGPTQLRPNPNITAVMNAIEQFDTFLGGGTTFDVPDFGEIAVRALGKPGELGVGLNLAKPGETAVAPPASRGGQVGGGVITVRSGSISVRKV